MFSSVKETFCKLVQSPFMVVKAEDELVDPQRVLRVYFVPNIQDYVLVLISVFYNTQAKCEQEKEAQLRFAKLEECNSRVRSKKSTAETCVEELWDFLEVVDKCVAKDLFDQLK